MRHDHRETPTSYLHFQNTLHYHEGMLADHVRNKAFHRALKKRVTEGATVLDIGSGTGVWAIMAAKLGAARVVAVEKEPMLIPVINSLAQENRVSDRIEVVQGDSREIKLKGKFDLIISETIGNQAFDEEIVPIMMDAKKRFLKPGGSLIPSSVSLFAAPFHLDKNYRRLPEGVPVQGNYMEFVCQNLPILGAEIGSRKPLSQPCKIMEVDLTTIESAPSFEGMTATWKLNHPAMLNCFVVWADSLLTKGVRLSNTATSSWKPIVYPVEPMKTRGPADVKFQLSLTDNSTSWSVSAGKGPDAQEQSYSPIFPYMAIHAHMK